MHFTVFKETFRKYFKTLHHHHFSSDLCLKRRLEDLNIFIKIYVVLAENFKITSFFNCG